MCCFKCGEDMDEFASYEYLDKDVKCPKCGKQYLIDVEEDMDGGTFTLEENDGFISGLTGRWHNVNS